MAQGADGFLLSEAGGLEAIPTWRYGVHHARWKRPWNMLSLAVVVWHRRDVLTGTPHHWRALGGLHRFSVPLAGNSPYTFATFFSGLELVAPGRRSGRVGYVPSILRSACRPEMRGQFSVRSVRSPTTARQDMFGGDAPDRGKKRSPSEIVVTEESTCLISSDLANPTSISR